MAKRRKSFYRGEMETFPKVIEKAACKVSGAVVPLNEAVETLGMEESEIRGSYRTFKIDSQTYVQL